MTATVAAAATATKTPSPSATLVLLGISLIDHLRKPSNSHQRALSLRASSSWPVPHVHVATDAPLQVHFPARSHRRPQRSVCGDRVDHLRVTAKAVALQHLGVGGNDPNRLGKVLQRECLGVAVA